MSPVICPDVIYKVLSLEDDAALWAAPAAGYGGSAHDRRDGFIHLSTAAQLAETLRRHYAEPRVVMLLTVAVAALPGDRLRFEASRGGDFFPHLYDVLPAAAIRRRDLLTRGGDGLFHLPSEL